MILKIHIFLVLSAFFGGRAFEIPLPFGSLNITKMPEGGAEIGINNGLNVLGYGSNSGMQINVDKNGTFTTKSKGGVLVNGTKYGTNSTYGVEKGKGVVAGTNLNMGNNQTIRGGLGNEGNFIGDLINFLKTSAKPKANRAGNP